MREVGEGLLALSVLEFPLVGLSALLYASGQPVPPFPLVFIAWLLLPLAAVAASRRRGGRLGPALLLAAHGVAVLAVPPLLVPGGSLGERAAALVLLAAPSSAVAAYSLAAAAVLLRGGALAGFDGAAAAAATAWAVSTVWPVSASVLGAVYLGVLRLLDRDDRYVALEAALVVASLYWALARDPAADLAPWVRALVAVAAALSLFGEYTVDVRRGSRLGYLKLFAAALLAAYSVPALFGSWLGAAAVGIVAGFWLLVVAACYALDGAGSRRGGVGSDRGFSVRALGPG